MCAMTRGYTCAVRRFVAGLVDCLDAALDYSHDLMLNIGRNGIDYPIEFYTCIHSDRQHHLRAFQRYTQQPGCGTRRRNLTTLPLREGARSTTKNSRGISLRQPISFAYFADLPRGDVLDDAFRKFQEPFVVALDLAILVKACPTLNTNCVFLTFKHMFFFQITIARLAVMANLNARAIAQRTAINGFSHDRIRRQPKINIPSRLV